MSFPKLPDCMFPQTVTIKISTDIVGRAGGANPSPASPGLTYKASVQDAGVAWDAMRAASVSQVHVNFQVNPDDTLPRPLSNGDEILWGSLVLAVKGPIRNRGGLGFVYRAECEYVKT